MKPKNLNTDALAAPKKRHNRTLLFFLCLGGFLSSVTPLLVLMIVKWDVYTAIPGGSIRLCAGGMFVAALLLYKVMGKAKLPSRLTVFAVALVLSYLLAALLSDLTLILWMSLLGEALDTFLFAPAAKRVRSRIEREKCADATAGRVEELLKNYVGGNKS